jgi:N-acetylglucosaminyldiphosphoundecaprenol N-acetyl-beta-D-mannosaminyltransferase
MVQHLHSDGPAAGTRALPTANILGVGVSAVNMAMALRILEDWIERREPHYVCVTGVHGVMESQKDAELRRIHNRAGLVTPDGMPLVWLSRALGYPYVERVYGPDLLLAFCRLAEEARYRIFFYGGHEAVPELLAARLLQKYPGLQVAGRYSPPFRELSGEEEEEIYRMINAAGPDVVFVGLSTPKQERWMARARASLEAPVLIGVGAAFDFHSGTKKQAPQWMRRSGLEWFYRLLQEPRRLGRRYLVNNPLFVLSVIRQLAGLKSYSIEN